MSSYTVSSVAELARLITKHAKQRQTKVLGAIRRAARIAANSNSSALKRNIPVAHGELRESVHAEGMLVVVDAPHAAAVNNGSRPHFPPLAPLIAWVKLRGTQGILTERQQGRLPGSSTRSAASGVAAMLRAQTVRGPAGYSPTDAAVEVARMIQRAIGAHGTKPSHFVEKSLPDMLRLLDQEIRKALGETLPGPEGGGAAAAAAPRAPDTRVRDERGRFKAKT